MTPEEKQEYEKVKHSFWDELKHIDGLGTYSRAVTMSRHDLLVQYLDALPQRAWRGEGSYTLRKHEDELVAHVEMSIEKEKLKQES